MAPLLLIPLAALMLADLLLTLEGLKRRDVEERNSFALLLMANLSQRDGLIVHQAGWFALITAAVLLFPSQWFGPLLACLSYGAGVVGNVRILRLASAKGA